MTPQQKVDREFSMAALKLRDAIDKGEAKEATPEEKKAGKEAQEKLETLEAARKTDQEQRRNLRLFGDVRGPRKDAGKSFASRNSVLNVIRNYL
jgi:hypothetical protein